VFNGGTGAISGVIRSMSGANTYCTDNILIYNNLSINWDGTNFFGKDSASTGEMRNSNVFSNTIVGTGTVVLFNDGPAGNISVRNNLLVNGNGNMTGADNRSNNAYYNCTNTPSTAADANRVALIVDPLVGGGDYSLAAGSAAIGAGYVLVSPYEYDILGASRGAAFDIGAYEYATGPDTTPAAFSWDNVTVAALSSVNTTDNAALASFDNAVSSISGAGCTFSVNGAVYGSDNGTVFPGDNVSLRVTASNQYSTVKTCNFTAGTRTVPWTVTTLAPANYPVLPRFRGASMSGGWK
jgi:hypothetical protein